MKHPSFCKAAMIYQAEATKGRGHCWLTSFSAQALHLNTSCKEISRRIWQLPPPLLEVILPRCQETLTLAFPHPRLTHLGLIVGTRNRPLQKQQRNRPFPERTPAFDRTAPTMAPQGRAGRILMDLVTASYKERAASNPHEVISNRVPSPISFHVFDQLRPSFAAHRELSLSFLFGNPSTNFANLRISNHSAPSTITCMKELERRGVSSKLNGRAESRSQDNRPILA
jgi:hypothetical protein